MLIHTMYRARFLVNHDTEQLDCCSPICDSIIWLPMQAFYHTYLKFRILIQDAASNNYQLEWPIQTTFH